MATIEAKTDSQVQRDVFDELKWDTRVKETDVGVTVDAGVVTLTGTVDSWAARVAAQEAAHRVAGVLDVANDVRVKLPGPSERDDTEVAHAVRTALEWGVLVPHDRIRSTVSNGVVTLEGEVTGWAQHEDAERCVRNLAGVREVVNHIKIEPEALFLEPKAVRKAIESALERRAGHTARHVHLSVAADKVTLTGGVPSSGELKAVVGAVRGTPGVRFIDNQLQIRPLTGFWLPSSFVVPAEGVLRQSADFARRRKCCEMRADGRRRCCYIRRTSSIQRSFCPARRAT